MRVSTKVVHVIARVMQAVFVLNLLGTVFGLVLVWLGHVQIDTVTHAGRVIAASTLAQPYVKFAAERNGWMSNGLWQSLTIVGAVTPAVRILLTAVITLTGLPVMAVYAWLVRLFANVARDRVFDRDNAQLLIKAGYATLLGLALQFGLPPLAIALYRLAGATRVTIGPAWGSLTSLVEAGVLLVMGYVLAYGLQLRQETEGLV